MPTDAEFDAIVVGAGFGGIQTLFELRRLGLKALLVDEASDVGGTWYWNRYPGARTDSEAWVYSFSFSEDLCQEWDWPERYPAQADVLRYLQFAVDQLGLRKDMQFDTRVESARYDESEKRWVVTTSDHASLRCRFLVLATGPLSRPLAPPFEGLDSFRGDWYLTARWPYERVDFTGKRVAIVGVGSTGIQLLPVVAQEAEHVSLFQRTPNYVINAANRKLSSEDRLAIKRRYGEIWTKAKGSWDGLAFDREPSRLADLEPDEQLELLEELWQKGGFEFFATFQDVMVDQKANDALSDFIRDKIRSVVKDPATAELLCPKGYPFGLKRPPLGHSYLEAFNRDNVALVDVNETPIDRITPEGIRVGADEYLVDVIIFALGFDASTGALLAMDIVGAGGVSLREKWASGPRTYLSIGVDGFPNLFMVAGPQAPFANMPVVLDSAARFASAAISYCTENDVLSFSPTPDAVQDWCNESDRFLDARPMQRHGVGTRSFFLGTNVPGKPTGAYFYFGGIPRYSKRLESEVATGFPGFET